MKCSNCDAELKSGFLSNNNLLEEKIVNFINEKLKLNADSYCNKCGDELHKKAKTLHNSEQKELEREYKIKREELKLKQDFLYRQLNRNIDVIPVITTHTPYNWEYIALGIVTSQIVTGTGVISEVLSDVTDFFGANSNSFTNKIITSEKYCLNQLKAKALKLGGNAVIATDIDYGEVGASKGMLMVCAAGTAVKLINTKALGEDKRTDVEDIVSWQTESRIISKLLLFKGKQFLDEYDNYKFDIKK